MHEIVAPFTVWCTNARSPKHGATSTGSASGSSVASLATAFTADRHRARMFSDLVLPVPLLEVLDLAAPLHL